MSHSEILGSRVICTYPKLIAAYHVLHRLREPRHPPCALSYFRQCDSHHTLRQNRKEQHKPSSYYQLLIHKSNLQSCLCQYVKDRFRRNRHAKFIFISQSCRFRIDRRLRFGHPIHRMVENNGFEPLTPCLQSRCSSQLS